MTADLVQRLKQGARDVDGAYWTILLEEAADELEERESWGRAAQEQAADAIRFRDERDSARARLAAAERVIALLKEWDSLEASARSGDASAVMDQVWVEVARYENQHVSVSPEHRTAEDK